MDIHSTEIMTDDDLPKSWFLLLKQRHSRKEAKDLEGTEVKLGFP